MSKGSNSGKGGKPSGSRARSVGAAGGSQPNGAILDDTAEVLAMRSQRFKAWAKGYRDQKLKPNAKLEMIYDKSPSPYDRGM